MKWNLVNMKYNLKKDEIKSLKILNKILENMKLNFGQYEMRYRTQQTQNRLAVVTNIENMK